MGCVYKITCQSNGLSYIGQTRSSVDKRWKEHVRHARQNRRKSWHLSNAIMAYGKEDFRIEILFEGDDNLLNCAEIALIKEHNTFHPNGMNLTIGGLASTKTESVKNKISATVTALWKNASHRTRISQIASTPLIGTCLKTGEETYFKSGKDTESKGFNPTRVSTVVNGHRTHHKGYTWRRA